MAQKDITSMRGTIEFLKEQNELLVVSNKVNPVYEIAGIQKALDGGPALLFENIEGYAGARNIGNLFGTRDRFAKIFDIENSKNIKFKCLEAIKKPIPPKVVEDAPCQEVVITDNIDVMGTLPIIKHSERDGGRLLGGGIILLTGKYFEGGNHLSFNRMSFRGKDWGSINFAIGTHLEGAGYLHRGAKIPLTINISTPPAVNILKSLE